MNATAKKPLPDWLPFLIGALLVVQFAGLGAWQVNRGLDKRAQQELFSDEAGFSAWSDGMPVRSFQRLRVDGRFDSERQLLLDNIIIESRLGYYVVTALDLGTDRPLLLVNRGWIPRDGDAAVAERITAPDTPLTVRGRVGALPRAGYKMGDAIPDIAGWPRKAVYPSLDDVAAALGRPVQPFVLLLDPEDAHGYFRHWVPEEMGPGRHFAYALQWFAMAGVLSVILIWNYRRRRASNG